VETVITHEMLHVMFTRNCTHFAEIVCHTDRRGMVLLCGDCHASGYVILHGLWNVSCSQFIVPPIGILSY